MFNRFRSVVLVASIPLFALASTACGGSVSEQPVASQSSATKAPVAQGAHGPVKLVGEALGEVPLRPEQRTEIEKLAADAEARHQAGGTAHKDLMEAVALQIEAGKIDRAALQPKIDAAAAQWDKSRDADRAALERLHAILTPDQRAAFVDALEAKFQAKRAEHGDHADHARGHKGGPMKEWATALKLTDDQQTQIKDAMKAKFQAMRAQHQGDKHAGGDHDMGKKVLAAFKTDHFVMAEVAPKVDSAKIANKMSDRFIGMVEVVVPILTPEQRTLAAAKVRTDMTTARKGAL